MLYYSCRVIIYHTKAPRQHIFLFYGILFLNFQSPCLLPALYEKKQSTHSYVPLLFICFFKFRCSCCEIITKVANQSLFLSIAEANGFFKKSFMLLTTSICFLVLPTPTQLCQPFNSTSIISTAFL